MTTFLTTNDVLILHDAFGGSYGLRDEDALIELALGVAAGGLNKQDIAKVFEKHLENLE